MKGGLLFLPRYLEHEAGKGHPESPERLKAVWEHLQAVGLTKQLELIEPSLHDLNWIETIHDPAYIRRVKESCERGDSHIDSPDVGICRASFEIAKLAVDGALTLVDWVTDGEVRRGFGLIRPPGHHAERDRALGFCLFNNIAIAARYAQKQYGLKKVLILDWDVHHGNGTQHAFEKDPSVLYVSTHQWPLYPGTGRREEKGTGNILNIPLPPESGDSEHLKAFQEEIHPAVEAFRPELILISAGFDAHVNDPLANMSVTEMGYRRMTGFAVRWAEDYAQGRIVSLLEGGYHLPSLARSVQAHLEAMF